MIKRIIFPLLLLIINSILYIMVQETVERTKFSQEKIMRIDKDPSLQRSLSYLTPSDKKNLILQSQKELHQLDLLKSIALPLFYVLGILILAIMAFRPTISIKRYDGLTILIAYFLFVFLLFGTFYLFESNFDEGQSAINKITATSALVLLIITPLIFLSAFKLNKFETAKEMHHKKWISLVALALTLVSGLTALILGFALLMTPDLSNMTL